MHTPISMTPSFCAPTTNLWLGRQLLQTNLVPDLIQQFGHQAVIVADPAAPKLPIAWDAETLEIPLSAAVKSASTKEWIEQELFARKCGRDTVLIALGGGATTDVAGFVASTYLRGIPLILIPTTLLAIVDASIGGKTSVDTPYGKNLLGTYYQPKAIISDLDMLSSLPEREWQNGFAEILKAALIADPTLWSLCTSTWRQELEPIVERAARVKMATIEQDPVEKGLRRILNFGHTVGHALEAAANYEMAHGEAVALGMIAESYLSLRMSYLPERVFQEIVARIETAGFMLRLPTGYTRDLFFEAMSYDKKKAKGVVRVTLLQNIGETMSFNGEYCCAVPDEMLVEMTRWMELRY